MFLFVLIFFESLCTLLGSPGSFSGSIPCFFEDLSSFVSLCRSPFFSFLFFFPINCWVAVFSRGGIRPGSTPTKTWLENYFWTWDRA